jgi:hypothetical protein
LPLPHGRLVFTFHHWRPEAWAALTIALKRAGFGLVAHYDVQSESATSVHINGMHALVHDTILVLAADLPEETMVVHGQPLPEHSGVVHGQPSLNNNEVVHGQPWLEHSGVVHGQPSVNSDEVVHGQPWRIDNADSERFCDGCGRLLGEALRRSLAEEDSLTAWPQVLSARV